MTQYKKEAPFEIVEHSNKYNKSPPDVEWVGDNWGVEPNVTTLESCLGAIAYELEEAYRLKTLTDTEAASFMMHLIRLAWDLVHEEKQ